MKKLVFLLSLCFSVLAFSLTSCQQVIEEEKTVCIDNDVGVKKSLQLEKLNLKVNLVEASKTVKTFSNFSTIQNKNVERTANNFNINLENYNTTYRLPDKNYKSQLIKILYMTEVDYLPDLNHIV